MARVWKTTKEICKWLVSNFVRLPLFLSPACPMASLDYLSLSNSSRMNHYSQYSWRGLKLKPSKCRQRGEKKRSDIFIFLFFFLLIDLHGGSRNGIFQIKCLSLSFWSPGESRSRSSSNWPTDVRQAFVPHCQLSLNPPCLSKKALVPIKCNFSFS